METDFSTVAARTHKGFAAPGRSRARRQRRRDVGGIAVAAALLGVAIGYAAALARHTTGAVQGPTLAELPPPPITAGPTTLPALTSPSLAEADASAPLTLAGPAGRAEPPPASAQPPKASRRARPQRHAAVASRKSEGSLSRRLDLAFARSFPSSGDGAKEPLPPY